MKTEQVFAKKCVSVPFQSRYFMVKLIPASTIILSTLLPGPAVHQLHAQTDPPIFRWGGSVEVSTSTLTMREGETVSYSVRLSEQPLADGWWVFVQVDGVVYHDGEFTKPGETEPWIRWVPSVGWKTDPVPGSSDPTRWRTVSITARQDDDDDDEFLTFTHAVWDKDTNCPEFLHAVAPVQVRIIDDDRPGGTVPDLEIQDAEVTEGGIAAFTVTLSSSSEVPVTVSYETIDGTATAGADYTTTSGTLSFTPGQTTKRVEVPTLEDDEAEETETFTVQLSAPSGATVADGTGTGTIIDDDGGGGSVPRIEIEDAEVTEGGIAAFTVTLSSSSEVPVTVSYETIDGTATAGADYTTTSGTLSFTPGQTTKRVEVPTLEDDEAEETETFTVQLSAPSGATVADGTGTGTITDNDEAPTITIGDARVTEGGTAEFTVTLSSAATGAVTVSYATVDGTATAGADYTTTSGMLTFEVNGDRTQRVEVPTLEDDEAEETETFTVQLSAPSGATVADGTGTGTITDNDEAPTITIGDARVTEGGIAEFTVTLSSAATGAVTVSYATVDGTATAGADYTTTSGMLTFEVNGDRTQRVEVPTLEDDEAEETETFTVQLSAPSGATVADGTGTGTITDNDEAPTITIGDARVTEGGIAEFTVTLSSAATRAVTVSYATVDGTATAGADYTTTSGMLTFEVNGDRTQRVEVPTLEDDEAEETETFTVQLSAPSGATVADGTGTGTITDNDEAPTITIGDARVTEGGIAEFTVTLSSAATRAVTVSYATVDGTATAGADYTTTSGMLTFEVNGDRTQRVEVPTLEDDEAEETETFTVQLSAPSGATVADGTGTGTITDNDEAPTITIGDARVTEGGTAAFTVTLSSAATGAVTVSYATVDGTATAGADYTTTSGMLTFEVNGDRTQRVEVPTLEDDEAEETETFTVQLSAPSGATVADGTGTGTITDNDEAPTITIGDARVTEGGTAAFTVTLSSAATGAVTVSYATVDGTATAGADYTTTSGMLTFEVNGDRTQRVEVPTLEDDEAEETETFTVQLSAPSGATVADGTGTGTITDNDEAPTITIGDARVTEGGTAAFTVTLSSAATGAVTVSYATVDGTATAGADYTTTSGMLTFEVNGDRTQRVEVPTLEDDEAEETETFTVQLSAPSGATVADGTGTGTITDNVQRSSRGVHRIVLPEMARAMAFTPNCRIEQALSDAPVQLAGDGGRARLSLSSALTSGRRTGPGAEPLTIDQALDDVRFLTSSQQEGGSGGFAAWGCADRLSLNGGGGGAVPWNGDVFSAHLGADVRLGSDVVAGFSLSRLRGSFEYRMGGSGGGEAAGAYEPRMTGIHPFLVWSVTPAVKLWATYGHGWGELQFTNDLAGRGDTGSSTLNSGIVGFVGCVLVCGATTVRVKGEWAIAYMDLGAADRGLFDALKVYVQRVRYRAEVRQEHFLASGHWLSPWAELGFRHDAGDGERGGGLELGGGLRYRNSDTGLSVESEGRWLAFHQSTIHEWGFGTRILYDPGASERGVSVGLTPTWGRTASGVAQLWEQGSAVPTSYDATGPRLEAHVGYGFGVPRRRGALTPYVSMALGDELARGYRVGSHLATGRSTNVNLELERRGHGAAPATYGITARGTILF